MVAKQYLYALDDASARTLASPVQLCVLVVDHVKTNIYYPLFPSFIVT